MDKLNGIMNELTDMANFKGFGESKEIIIDGVGCVFYNNGKCENPNGMSCNCINNAVCYYKELKRLEFELKVTKADYEASEQKNAELKQTLQEIKAVAEQLLEKGLEPQSVEHQLRLRGKRELASIILDLITKAEEE